MKKMIRIVVLAVAAFSTTVSYGSVSTLKVQNIVSIEAVNINNNKPKLIVRNKKGVALLESTDFSSNDIESLVNEMNLSDGTYTYEIVKDTVIEITTFVVSESSLSFNSEGKKTIFTPMLRVKDDLLLVSQLSLLKEPLRIKMYYNAKENDSKYFDLIYSEKIEEDLILERVYNLDKSKTGDYKIEFISNGKVFTEKFTL